MKLIYHILITIEKGDVNLFAVRSQSPTSMWLLRCLPLIEQTIFAASSVYPCANYSCALPLRLSIIIFHSRRANSITRANESCHDAARRSTSHCVFFRPGFDMPRERALLRFGAKTSTSYFNLRARVCVCDEICTHSAICKDVH